MSTRALLQSLSRYFCPQLKKLSLGYVASFCCFWCHYLFAVLVSVYQLYLRELLIDHFAQQQQKTQHLFAHESSETPTFDFIIVGSGTAGSVLANRLSASTKNFSVLLVEAGSDPSMLEIHIPAAFSKLFKSPMDWNFETVEQTHPAAQKRKAYIPRGKMIGGSSGMNAMIYIRGNREDYDKVWNLPNWTYEDLLPYFKKSEDFSAVESKHDKEFHGYSGEWKISDLRFVHQTVQLALDSIASALNIPKNDDFNGKSQIGVGLNRASIFNGERYSLAKAHLTERVLNRPNLFVRKNTMVTRVIFDEQDATRVKGVELMDIKTKQTAIVKASKEIILSAGAIGSPQILQLSGVGDASLLKSKQISPVKNLKLVGKELMDHPLYSICYNITTKDSLHSNENLKTTLDWILNRQGPLTSNIGELSAFLRTSFANKDKTLPDVQFISAPAYYVDHGFAKYDGDVWCLGAVVIDSETKGSVYPSSNNPLDNPVIDYQFFENRVDMDRMREAVKLMRKVAATQPLASILDKEVFPGPQVQTDEQIESHIHRWAMTCYHQSCTCKMGKNEEDSVVHFSNLKVHGFQNLRVIDASIFPNVISGNTNAPTVAVAEKGADLILSEYNKQ